MKLNDIHHVIIDMRKDGLSLDQIAIELNKTYIAVQAMVSRLIRAGLIPAAPPSLRSDSERHLAHEEVKGTVMRMRLKGASIAEIAFAADRSENWIKKVASELIEEGKIEPITRPNEELKAEVARLRNKGLGNVKIAEQLGITISSANHYAHMLLKEGKIGPVPPDRTVAEKHDKIRLLHSKGWSNEEIAEAVGSTMQNIKTFLSKERSAGRVPAIDRSALEELESDIADLRNEGCNDELIAEVLEIPLGRVKYYAEKLRKLGQVQRRHKSQNPEFAARQEKIRNLVKQGMMYKDIAEQVGSTEGSIKTFVKKERDAGRLPAKS